MGSVLVLSRRRSDQSSCWSTLRSDLPYSARWCSAWRGSCQVRLTTAGTPILAIPCSAASSRMTSIPSASGSHALLMGFIAETSGSLWLNVPAAALVVGALTWVSFGGGVDKQMQMSGSWRTRRFDSQGAPRDYKPPGSAAGVQKADARWRDKVRAPLVEHAWETLCGSIIQEVGVLSAPLPPTAGTACSVSLLRPQALKDSAASAWECLAGCSDLMWCLAPAVCV